MLCINLQYIYFSISLRWRIARVAYSKALTRKEEKCCLEREMRSIADTCTMYTLYIYLFTFRCDLKKPSWHVTKTQKMKNGKG